jgi:hypothetical protein
MTTSPVHSSSPLPQIQPREAATSGKSAAKQVSTLPQDTVTLSTSAKTQPAAAAAKDQAGSASGNRTKASVESDRGGH